METLTWSLIAVVFSWFVYGMWTAVPYALFTYHKSDGGDCAVTERFYQIRFGAKGWTFLRSSAGVVILAILEAIVVQEGQLWFVIRISTITVYCLAFIISQYWIYRANTDSQVEARLKALH